MSSEPPSEDRPTGPPSGPLSGGGGSGSGRSGPEGPPPEPTRPDWHSTPSGEGSTQISGPTGAQPPEPPGPPAPPSGAHGAPPPAGEPGKAWWRSAPKVALLAGVLVAAAALLVFFLRPEGGGEVFLQAASAHGNDPFTASTASDAGTKEAAAAPVTPAEGGNRTYPGSTQGLYGGTQNAASCDVDRQIRYLKDDQAKSRAFASGAGIQQDETERFLRGLTPLLLRSDTRVTNHGYKDGAATTFQSVLQAGTAVLVDNRGMPRVRCACGNPLGAPVAATSTPKTKGEGWSAYKSSNAVTVTQAATAIYDMVVRDPVTGQWFKRPVGTDGESDRTVPKPSGAMPSGPASPGSEESSSGEPPTPSSSAPPPPSQAPPSPQKPPTEPGPAYGPQNRGLARPGGAA
ncbi:hypothetical protein IPZ58_09015 [Streptomyces roseoverticillatus]|uniref:DUF6777 domain-containing protein n=1 Tax=Streptomyces roseoverticillatus TaxID=66429 RepID=UPI001F47547C|nr:DUF6777 domain-containing protein [Streptomyces roseoverticillatus]MCF3101722.1 hypothetical protein [Streptomyces roseoverticillatus]